MLFQSAKGKPIVNKLGKKVTVGEVRSKYSAMNLPTDRIEVVLGPIVFLLNKLTNQRRTRETAQSVAVVVGNRASVAL